MSRTALLTMASALVLALGVPKSSVTSSTAPARMLADGPTGAATPSGWAADNADPQTGVASQSATAPASTPAPSIPGNVLTVPPEAVILPDGSVRLPNGGVRLQEILFDPGRARMTPGGTRKTLAAADVIKRGNVVVVKVIGHTDTRGRPAVNDRLSLRRAGSVAELLSRAGVPLDRVEIAGFGERNLPEPTADNMSEPLNRCVEILVFMAEPQQTPRREGQEQRPVIEQPAGAASLDIAGWHGRAVQRLVESPSPTEMLRQVQKAADERIIVLSQLPIERLASRQGRERAVQVMASIAVEVTLTAEALPWPEDGQR